jgi:O-antigen/teichoic acid export membrane protein
MCCEKHPLTTRNSLKDPATALKSMASKTYELQIHLHRMIFARPIAANIALTAATNLVLASFGIASGIVAARLLGPHGRGELAAIQTWPSFVATLAMLGMPEAVVYYSARSRDESGRYLGSAVAVALLSSLPFITAAYLLMPILLHAQAPTIISAGRWYLLLIPIYAFVGMLMHPLRGRGDFVPWNLMRLMPNVLWFGVLLLAWILARMTPTFVTAANLIVLSLLLPPFAAVLIRRVPGPFTPDKRKLSPMLHYGLPCMITGVPQLLNSRLDQMLMAALLPPRDLGLYVVAVAWSSAPAPLLNAVGAVTTPAVASAADHAQGARQMAAGARATAALALVLCLGLEFLTPLAIAILFGERFRTSVPAALVLVPATGVLGLNLVLQEGLRGLGRPYSALQAELAGLVVTAAALAALLRPMGIMGAAFASLLGYTTVTVVLLYNARRHAGTPMRALLMPHVSEIISTLTRLGSAARKAGARVT